MLQTLELIAPYVIIKLNFISESAFLFGTGRLIFELFIVLHRKIANLLGTLAKT